MGPDHSVRSDMTQSSHLDLPEFRERFTVLESFRGGEGWSGAVRQADGREFVLKILDSDVEFIEPSLLASLRHPSIPGVLETGQLADGRHYVLREFLPGDPLGEHLPLPTEEVLELGIQLLEILAYVHLRGILHQDIKPANILRQVRDGAVQFVLLDFGLGTRATEQGDGGTMFFAAPERLLGLPTDARSDLFSLGVSLYCALRGMPSPTAVGAFVRRFPETDFWTALAVDAALPAPFDRFLPRLLNRQPSARFTDAREALEALAGRSGRPSIHLLRPDPVAMHNAVLGRALAELPPRHDLTIEGSDAETRRGLALHAATELTWQEPMRMREEDDRITLIRGGDAAVTVTLPGLDPTDVAPHLATVLGLEPSDAMQAAESLCRDAGPTVTIGSIDEALSDLVEQGRVVPDGTRWIWPDAVCGRLAHPSEARPLPAEPGAIRRAAARGQTERALAAYERKTDGARAPHDRELRAALASGLIAGGEPSVALGFTFDLPIHRARALVDLGQLDAARAQLANVAATPAESMHAEESERDRLIATIEHVSGDSRAALARLTAKSDDLDPASRVVMSQILIKLDRRAEAEALLEALLQELDPTDEPFLVAATCTSAAECQRARGDLAAAEALHRRAQEILHELGHARHSATAATNLGVIAKDLGRFEDAIQHQRRARAMYEHVGDRRGMAFAEANLGILSLEMGDPATALRRLELAHEQLTALGAHQPLPRITVKIALAYAQLGDRERSEQQLALVGTEIEGPLAREAREVRAMWNQEMKPSDDPSDITTERRLGGPESIVPKEVFRTFLAVNRRLAGEADLDRAMGYLLDAAVTLTGGRAGYLLLVRGDGLRQEFRAGDVDTGARAFSRTMVNRSIQQRRTQTGADLLNDHGLSEMASVQNLRQQSAICTPFRTAAGHDGAIYIEHTSRASAFGEREKEHLEILADQAAIAVDRMLHEESLLTRLEQSQKQLAVARRSTATGQTKMIGKSRAMTELRKTLARIATSELPVIIRGETGAGKELVARAIHDGSARNRAPFLAENCSAIPESLMESEFFGHCRGAFTGADDDRAGLLEMASGGTLFLDEIGDMPMALQVKLLRALQESAVRRIGGQDLIPIDVRLVSATHKDLGKMIQEGTFREDLFYRIGGAEIVVPPLRERGRDVLLIAEAFLAEFNQKHSRSHELGPKAEAQLLAYPWPGNVRELHHVISRALILADHRQVDDLMLPAVNEQANDPGFDWPAITLQEAEERTIAAALKATGGDKTKAARLLGVSRTGLYEKIRRAQERG